ncbi:MAG: zinc-binding dehydrogenase, partial [Planctomycetota bacterium]
DRLRLADAFGADRTVDVESEDLPAFVRSITDGYGADTAFECSGAPAAVRTGLACLRKRGRFVQAGILHREVSLDFDDVFFVRELTLAGSHTSNPRSWELALRLLAAGSVDLEPLVSESLPLAEWERAFELIRTRRAVKVVLTP